jgi:hypothetical protein
MLAGCGQSSDAAPAKAQPARQSAAAQDFDIAGIHLGDSFAAASAVLRQRGFTTQVFSGNWSFDDWVENSRARGLGRSAHIEARAPKELQGRKGTEFVSVMFRAAGDGMIVEQVSYETPTNGRSAEELMTEVKARYPAGVQPNPRFFRICARTDGQCTTGNPEADYISYTVRDPFRIVLFAGAAQERRWKAAFDAAVRKRVGPAPSSF